MKVEKFLKKTCEKINKLTKIKKDSEKTTKHFKV